MSCVCVAGQEVCAWRRLKITSEFWNILVNQKYKNIFKLYKVQDSFCACFRTYSTKLIENQSTEVSLIIFHAKSAKTSEKSSKDFSRNDLLQCVPCDEVISNSRVHSPRSGWVVSKDSFGRRFACTGGRLLGQVRGILRYVLHTATRQQRVGDLCPDGNHLSSSHDGSGKIAGKRYH